MNGFLLIFNSNIGPKYAPLWDIRLRNLGDLEFDLSGSLKVKSDGAISLPIYALLLVFNSDIGPNIAPLQDISLQNMSDLDFDLSRSLKIKSSDAVGLPMYDFLLVSDSSYMPISGRLGVIATLVAFLVSLRPNLGPPPPQTTLSPGRYFYKFEWYPLWVRGKAFTEKKVDRFIFLDILQTDTRTHMCIITPTPNPSGV